jgi:hypothetical protein
LVCVENGNGPNDQNFFSKGSVAAWGFSLLVEGALCGAEFVLIGWPQDRCSFWLELTVKAVHEAQMGVETGFLLLGNSLSRRCADALLIMRDEGPHAINFVMLPRQIVSLSNTEYPAFFLCS